MSPATLIPDRQLTFSPDLAATIGLEAAILLQGIGPLLPRERGQWHALVIPQLERQFPFWNGDRIRQLLQNLAELGILSVLPGENHHSLRVAPADASLPTRDSVNTSSPAISNTSRANAPPWQPQNGTLDLLALNHGIDRQFALAQLASFDALGDNAVTNNDSRFRQHVLAAWRHHQHHHPAFATPTATPFDSQWQPSEDAMEIMLRSEVDAEFIDSIRPEFILYWRERGGPPKEVNSRFIEFVRNRWVRYQSGLAHSTEPRPMVQNWQPHDHVYDILAMSGIEREWAEARVPEFALYWSDSNELHTSWNSKFLQHVKHQWRWEQRQGGSDDGQQRGVSAGAGTRTRDRSIADDLSDTSWAN